jgi:hypothetical protein
VDRQRRKPYGADPAGDVWDRYAGDEIDGVPEFYEVPAEELPETESAGWAPIDLAEQFALLEIDFQTIYGIDLSGHVRTQEGWVRVMTARSGRWFIWRVLGLSGVQGSRWAAFVQEREKERAEQGPDDDPDRDI